LRQLCTNEQFQHLKSQYKDTQPELVAEWGAAI